MKVKVKASTAHTLAKTYYDDQSIFSQLKSLLSRPSNHSEIKHTVLPALTFSKDLFFVNETKRLEAQFYEKVDKDSELSVSLLEIIQWDGATIETMELQHSAQLEKPASLQKYMIFLVGNGMCMQDMYQDIRRCTLDTQYNAISFNYRGIMRSEGKLTSQVDLVYDAISQIERLRQQGVKPENITLIGHSLGAAIATLASYVYFKLNMPIRLFNGCSFSSFAEMIYHHDLLEGKSESFALNHKKQFEDNNFAIEVAKYFKALPEESKDYIVIKPKKMPDRSTDGVEDGVIPRPASLHASLKEERKKLKQSGHLSDYERLKMKNRKVISRNRLFGAGHNDALSTLMCGESLKTAEEYRLEFILNTNR